MHLFVYFFVCSFIFCLGDPFEIVCLFDLPFLVIFAMTSVELCGRLGRREVDERMTRARRERLVVAVHVFPFLDKFI